MLKLTRRTALRGGAVALGAAFLNPLSTRSSNYDELLRRLSVRLSADVPANYRARLAAELEFMGRQGWLPSLTPLLLVTEAARRRGLFAFPISTSLSASLIAYSMGITLLDPLAHRLSMDSLRREEGRTPTLLVSLSSLASLDFLQDVAAAVPEMKMTVQHSRHGSGNASAFLSGPAGRFEVELTRYEELDDVQHAVDCGFNHDEVNLEAGALEWRRPGPFDKTSVTTFEDLTQALVLDRLDHEVYASVPREQLWRAFFLREPGAPTACASYLTETRGLLLFQEQLIALVQGIAGVSFADAHKLRRALGTRGEAELGAERARFIASAFEHSSMPADAASTIFHWLKDGFLIPMSRPAAVASAALWCWTKAARRFRP